MPNNQYERDFNDLGALKRPGRLDFRILNNVDDAGDGHPGLQKAIRNYFHEGYLEKDINMNTHKIINLQAPSGNNDGARKVDVDTVQNDLDGFTDELKNLTTHEIQQLETLGEIITISEPQWGYLGASNQGVATTSNVAFNQITMSGNIIMGANNITLGIDQTVDGVDVDSHTHGGAGQGGTIAFSSLSGDIVYTQLDSIVDIAGTGATNLISRADHLHTNVDGSSKIAHANTTGRTANDHHSQSHVLSGGDHTASGLTTGYVIRATTATTFAWTQLGHGDLSGIGSNAHSVIDTHLGSTSNPHSVSLEQARTQGNGVSGQIDMNQNLIIDLPNCGNDNDVARKKYVDDTIKNYLPLGTILMYKGTGWVDNSTIPGWYICNAANETAHGTPNLTNKFIRSEASSGATGGSDDAVVVTHNHSGSADSNGNHLHYLEHNGTDYWSWCTSTDLVEASNQTYPTHTRGAHNHNLTIANAGVSGVGANKPSYYALIFIMRVS